MSEDEINELVNRISRASAQEALASRKAYISIDTPSTAIWVISGIVAIVVGYITLILAPVHQEVENNKDSITKMDAKMEDGFKYLAELIQGSK